MILKKIKIGIGQIGFLYTDEQLSEILETGSYKRTDWKKQIKVDGYELNKVICSHSKMNFLFEKYHKLLSKYVERIYSNKNEIVFIILENLVIQAMSPESEIYIWKNIKGVKIERYQMEQTGNISTDLTKHFYELYTDKNIHKMSSVLDFVHVDEKQETLVFENGAYSRTLKPGQYVFWTYGRTYKTVPINTKIQILELSGQEIITKDKVSLRINASMEYKITDPLSVYQTWDDYHSILYKELQFAIREAIGTLTLEEILDDKFKALSLMQEYLIQSFDKNIKIGSVGIKDIILPGDMKELMNRVVEAQKEAEANNIKRKEETAATRSLHNTARMLENNPVLLRLKEIKALEKVMGKVNNISIHNGIEGLMNDFVKLK